MPLPGSFKSKKPTRATTIARPWDTPLERQRLGVSPIRGQNLMMLQLTFEWAGSRKNFQFWRQVLPLPRACCPVWQQGAQGSHILWVLTQLQNIIGVAYLSSAIWLGLACSFLYKVTLPIKFRQNPRNAICLFKHCFITATARNMSYRFFERGNSGAN